VPATTFAAEAERGRFVLTDFQVAMEVEAIHRAAQSASRPELDLLSARAKRLATLYSVWSNWFTVGMVEARRAGWREARAALECAVALSGGCTPAVVELVSVCVAQGDADAALAYAERVCELEGQTARTLGVLATALLAAS